MKFVAVVIVVVLAASGCFVLERADGLAPGTVRGRAVVGGDAVDVSAVVSGIAPVDSDDGAFVVAGLPVGEFALRLSDDVDGDGAIDRGAVVPFTVPAQRDGAPAGVDLGDIDVGAVFVVSGDVVDGDGGGLDGVHVVVFRKAVDATAEADVGVVAGSYATFVAGGDVSVVAFADGGRQSQVVDLALDGDRDGIDLRVVDAASADVSGSVVPAKAAARVFAGDRSANVGVFFSVDAGVYDAVFRDGDDVIGLLAKQVAIAGVQTTWGPAIANCGVDGCVADVGEGEGEVAVGEGEGEGEGPNTPPTVDTVRAQRRVLSRGAETVVVVNSADADGDDVDVVYALVPDDGTLFVTTVGNEARVALVAPRTAAFSRAELHALADDGTDVSDTVVADLVVADGVFVGTVDLLIANAANWLDEAVPTVGDVVVLDSDADGNGEAPSWGSLQVRSGFFDADAVTIDGDLVIEVGASAFFDGFAPISGNATVAGACSGPVNFSVGPNHVVRGNIGGFVVDAGNTVTLDPSVNVNAADVTVDGSLVLNGALLAVDGDLTINGTVGGDDGIIHFLGSNFAINGTLDLSADGKFSFGFVGGDDGNNVVVGGSNVAAASWANLFVFSDGATVTINPGAPVVVATLSVGDNATLVTNDSRLVINGAVNIDAGAAVVSQVVEYNSADIVADGTIGGVDVDVGESKRLLGNATTNTPSTLSGGLVVGDGTPSNVAFSSLTISATGNLSIAPTSTVTVTSNFQSTGGTIGMSAASRLLLLAPSDFSLSGTSVVADSSVVLGDGAARSLTWGDGGATLALGDLEVRDNFDLIIDADLTVDALTVGQNALVLVNSGSLTVNSCVNNGGSVTFGVCP